MHPRLLNYYDGFFLTLSKVTDRMYFAVNNSLIMNMKTIQKLTTVFFKNGRASARGQSLKRKAKCF